MLEVWSMVPTALGTYIKRLREKRGLSQRGLAERAGISNVAINKIESGATLAPGVDVLEKIAAALKVPAAELLAARDDPAAISEAAAEYAADDALLRGVEINLMAIGELAPDEVEFIADYIKQRRRKVERDHGIGK